MRNSHARLVISLHEVFVTWLWKLQKKNIEKFRKTWYSCYMWIEVDSSLVRFFLWEPEVASVMFVKGIWLEVFSRADKNSFTGSSMRALRLLPHLHVLWKITLEWISWESNQRRCKTKEEHPCSAFHCPSHLNCGKRQRDFQSCWFCFMYFLCFSKVIT